MAKPFKGTITVDDRDSTPDWEPYLQPKAPEGAPNVLYIVLDDTGFSAMELRQPVAFVRASGCCISSCASGAAGGRGFRPAVRLGRGGKAERDIRTSARRRLRAR